MNFIRKAFAIIVGVVLFFLLTIIASFLYGVIKVYLWKPEAKSEGPRFDGRPPSGEPQP